MSEAQNTIEKIEALLSKIENEIVECKKLLKGEV